MKTIIYTCPYVPAEWIAAHGLRPSRIIPDSASSVLSLAGREGICPYVRGFVAAVTKNERAGAVIVTTVCDQMRRAFDVVTRECELPAFLMNVPNTWQNTAAQELYRDELLRLGRFLVRQGGKSPSNDALAEVSDGPQTSCTSRNTQYTRRNTRYVPLAIIGGPLMKQEFGIFDIVEESGGRIVLDATETGERGMCASPDVQRLRENPLRELAKAYFGGIVDASRRPDCELYDWLERRLAEREVQGVIFRRYVWCDMWHAQLRRLKGLIDLPVLDIDTAGDFKSEQSRTAGRIRAFLEMLL